MSNNENSPPADAFPNGRQRRGSITSQTFDKLFGRSNSTAGSPTAPFPGPITTAAAQDQRRRMSISTLGLSGTSPTQASPFPFSTRRASVSTAGSESIDENAIDDDDGPGRSQPTTPFTRRMSFGAQALRTVRGPTGNSPGAVGRNPSYTTSTPLRTIPSSGRGSGGEYYQSQSQASTQSKPRTASDLSTARLGESGFNWSEQLRSRAESSVSQQQRPSFSTSPNNKAMHMPHERAKSVSEMSTPPAAIPTASAPREIRKPDAFQERILKGDFYMD